MQWWWWQWQQRQSQTPLILSHRRQRQEAGRSEFEGNLLHCEFHGSKGHRETLSWKEQANKNYYVISSFPFILPTHLLFPITLIIWVGILVQSSLLVLSHSSLHSSTWHHETQPGKRNLLHRQDVMWPGLASYLLSRNDLKSVRVLPASQMLEWHMCDILPNYHLSSSRNFQSLGSWKWSQISIREMGLDAFLHRTIRLNQ